MLNWNMILGRWVSKDVVCFGCLFLIFFGEMIPSLTVSSTQCSKFSKLKFTKQE